MYTNKFLSGLNAIFASGRKEEVSAYLQTSLTEAEAAHDDPARVTILNEMIGYYRITSKYAEAIKYANEAIELMQRLGYAGTVDYGTTLLNAATAYKSSGNSKKALELFNAVLNIYRRELAPSDARLAALYNNLSAIHQDAGDYEKSSLYLEKAAAILSRIKGSEIDAATVYTNLALALFERKHEFEAMAHLQTALKLFESTAEGGKVDSRNAPHYAGALAGLAVAYYRVKEYAKAAELYEDALERIKDCYGENRDYAVTCRNAALAYEALGNINKTHELRIRAEGLLAALGLKAHGSTPAHAQAAPAVQTAAPAQTAHLDQAAQTAHSLQAAQTAHLDQVAQATHSLQAVQASAKPQAGKAELSSVKSVEKSKKGKHDLSPAEYARQGQKKMAETQETLLGINENLAQIQLKQAASPNVLLAAQGIPAGVAQEIPAGAAQKATMQGLDLARAYYEAYGREMICTHFSAYQQRIAVGLVGEGSECFGFDDEISRDHDFGPSFCLWLTRADYQSFGAELQKAYAALPQSFMGFSARVESAPTHAGRRIGVLCIEDFYRKYLGRQDAGLSPVEWLRLPENSLATATNGAVFSDPLGEFTRIREGLLGYYPEDVRLKKIAARAALMAQSGQVNYARCMSRGESVGAFMALGEFVKQASSMVFLLNRRYAPFYKWTHRAMLGLPLLPKAAALLQKLAVAPISEANWHFAPPQEMVRVINLHDPNVALIEELCHMVKICLRSEGLSDASDDFLIPHAEAVSVRIADSAIRSLHLMEG